MFVQPSDDTNETDENNTVEIVTDTTEPEIIEPELVTELELEYTINGFETFNLLEKSTTAGYAPSLSPLFLAAITPL